MNHDFIQTRHWVRRLAAILLTGTVLSAAAQGNSGKNAGETEALNVRLLKATEEVNEKEVVALLQKGANANTEDSRGWSPLILAAQTGNVAIVRALIGAGANVNHRTSTARGTTALCFAVGGGNTNIIHMLLDRGADINGKSRDGMTPLLFAASQGWLKRSELLLARGADVDLFGFVDSKGGTWNALIAAVDKNQMEVLRLLLQHGANPNATNNNGFTAFMEAAKRANPDAVKLLIEKGANVNARGPRGHTALIFAAYNGRTENVRLLMDAGADPYAMAKSDDDPTGKGEFNAGAIAVQQGHKEIAELIQQRIIKRLSR